MTTWSHHQRLFLNRGEISVRRVNRTFVSMVWHSRYIRTKCEYRSHFPHRDLFAIQKNRWWCYTWSVIFDHGFPLSPTPQTSTLYEKVLSFFVQLNTLLLVLSFTKVKQVHFRFSGQLRVSPSMNPALVAERSFPFQEFYLDGFD